jgi:hypothetical protein
MLKIVAVVAFVLGALVGFGLNLLLNLMLWCAVGLVLVCVFDVAAGLSQKVCSLRVKVREFLHRMTAPKTVQPVYRKKIWINI